MPSFSCAGEVNAEGPADEADPPSFTIPGADGDRQFDPDRNDRDRDDDRDRDSSGSGQSGRRTSCWTRWSGPGRSCSTVVVSTASASSCPGSPSVR